MVELSGSYCGPAPVAAEWMSRWNTDPVLLILFVVGGWIVWRYADDRHAGIAGLAALGMALVSPLCALSTALFAARSVHHLLLVGLAALFFARAFTDWQPRNPIPALLLSTATLWAWHIPAAYDAALTNKAFYWAMQLSLTGSAWAFWRALFASPPVPAALAIGGGAAQMGFLGAILTFAPHPLYQAHLTSTLGFGIGPLADQQLAGLIMWVFGMIPYAIGAGWLARQWMGDARRAWHPA